MTDKEEALRRSITEAVKAKEVMDTEAWTNLSLLSSDTQIDTVETFIDEIRIDGERFVGPLLWYVKLNYGQANDDDFLALSESFPGSFEGRIEDGQAVIDHMTADTSSFYE